MTRACRRHDGDLAPMCDKIHPRRLSRGQWLCEFLRGTGLGSQSSSCSDSVFASQKSPNYSTERSLISSALYVHGVTENEVMDCRKPGAPFLILGHAPLDLCRLWDPGFLISELGRRKAGNNLLFRENHRPASIPSRRHTATTASRLADP